MRGPRQTFNNAGAWFLRLWKGGDVSAPLRRCLCGVPQMAIAVPESESLFFIYRTVPSIHLLTVPIAGRKCLLGPVEDHWVTQHMEAIHSPWLRHTCQVTRFCYPLVVSEWCPSQAMVLPPSTQRCCGPRSLVLQGELVVSWGRLGGWTHLDRGRKTSGEQIGSRR